MAHFAEIDENNVVLRVLVVPDDQEERGQEYLSHDLSLGGTWIQTSYNSYAGKRRDPETGQITDEPGFRFNYASVGGVYDEEYDAFYGESPFPSWILNTNTFIWEAPLPYPNDSDTIYQWDEDSLSWQPVVFD